MCGIAGRLGVPSERLDSRQLEAAAALLRHRGPDQQAILRLSRAVLINTRLRIQDPSAAADLPFRLPGLVIAYNGEISNFLELERKHRLRDEFQFRSRSDVEVLAYLYLKLGMEFVHELTGMFSIALVDERKNRAYLVRDPYGITPLFYDRVGSELRFASELKVLRYWRGRKELSVNRQGLLDYLTLGYIPGAQTPYREIHELEPGRYLEFDLNGESAPREHRYYRPNYSIDRSLSEAEAAHEVRQRLEDSVRRHLIADAPIGMTLSGGVDTSSILALVHQFGRAEGFHTFSVKMGDSTFDESRYQRLMSKRTGSIHHEIHVGHEEVRENIVRHVAYLDEPSANGATIPSFLLAKEAARHVKVLLNGEGGDEIFNAYDTHLAFVVRRLYRRVPRPVRALLRRLLHGLPVNHDKLSFDFKAKRFTDGAELPTAAAHIYWRHGFREEDIRRLLLGTDGLRSTYVHFEELFAGLDFEDFARMSYLDLTQYLYGDLMVKNDRMMLAHAVESRFPLLDRPLVDFMTRVPPEYNIQRFQTRALQKRAMADLLPPEILARKSFGLEMPHSRWLLGPLRGLVEEHLSPEAVRRAGIFEPSEVARVWSEHERGVVDHGRGIWSLITAQIWHRLFLESDGYLTELGLQEFKA